MRDTGIHQLDFVPGRSGIPKNALSGYENFEAPDPAEWCGHGYAVVNVDDRGIFQSQGDHRYVYPSHHRSFFKA